MIRKINNYLYHYFGFKVKKVNSATNQIIHANHPIEGQYLTKRLPFIMNLPLEKGRVLRWYSMTSDSESPFVIAAKKYLESKDTNDIINLLKSYNTLVDMYDANEALGLKKRNKVFSDGDHCQKISFPWYEKTPESFYEAWEKSTLKENKKFGLARVDSIADSNISSKKLKIEAIRIKKLIDSIQNKGYLFDMRDCIGAIILYRDDEWCWYVSGGQHRASVLTALKQQEVPVIIKQIVRREDVEYWPNVVNGLFTKEVALDVFDRRFEPIVPDVFRPWVNFVKEKNL